MSNAKSNMFRNQWDNVPNSNNWEKYTLPSMTIPDQTSTVHEIMERFTQGGAINNLTSPRMGQETGEIETDDLLMMDNVEKAELAKRAFQNVLDLQRKKQAQERAAEMRKKKEEKEKQQQQQQQPDPQLKEGAQKPQ